ncbi:MAG: class I SAM-dependent methyltransferase [bacterium]|nr:class I SAM-dependent methyltransferase [bacterium]MBK8128575.1 class I SAM-dependent methyltransferase [bacterium]
MNFETIPCPVCTHTEHSPERIVSDRFRVLGERTYALVRCQKCKLVFLNPRPDVGSIGAFYDVPGYDPFGSAGEEPQTLSAKLYKKLRPLSIRKKAARVVAGLKPADRCLDVGCATGEFIVELKRRGLEADGCEPSAKAADYARDHYGLRVWTGGIESVPTHAGPYKLITMWHVLEHVHKLRDTLETARQLLAPRGKIAIAVPNPQSLDAKAYGDRWVGWDTPRHLYHFDPPVMLDLLIRAGFDPRSLGAVAFDAFYHSILSEPRGVAGLLRGGTRGMLSYASGVFGGPGSSELYLGIKRPT